MWIRVFQKAATAIRLTFSGRSFVWDAGVFFSYLLTAKLAQYILFTLHTSPALIWAPTGIALAAVLMRGNKMWLPISAAYLVAVMTLSGYLSPVGIVIATIGFTLQPLIGAWGMRKFGADGRVRKIRDVIVLVLGAFIIAAIGPVFNTFGQLLLHVLSDTMWLTFSRTWAGGVLGIIIMTPLIMSWYYKPYLLVDTQYFFETSGGFGFLLVSIYLLFWTNLSAAFVFPLIFLLCTALFWISFRFDLRGNAIALFLVAAGGIAGSIIMHPSPTPLNTQLFADELFLIIIAPLFMIILAIMEERRAADATLAEQMRMLQEVTEKLSTNDKAKNDFIAILAHELRNPLAAIVSTLELLKYDTLTEEGRSMVESGEQQTRAMRRLLDDLLDVARISERKLKIIKENTDLSTFIEYSVKATKHTMEAYHHTLTVSMPEETVILSIDPVRMEQVITNLLTNAAKYTPFGGAITLACLLEGPRLRIEVRDNGTGIAPQHLDKIFSPFHQLHPDADRASGIGVGLFLTRQIVEMHEGTIHADSEGEGLGSTFTILLPVAKVGQNASSHEMGHHAHAIPQKKEKQSKRVLIVDDNEVAALGISKLLAFKGFESKVVHTGQDAIDMFNDYQPEVVLLDIGLPDMSGHEVAKRIRGASSHGQSATLIALTGYGQEEDRTAALASGFDHHLTKPVSIEEIESIILGE
jgi:signal transduction histidine kinase/CheY-like chemotaxis protein